VSDPCWNSTICINCNNLSFIEKHITHLLESEGCRRLDQIDSTQIPYNWQSGSPLVITLSKSQIGWIVVKTSPFRFFCERASSVNRLRLSALAMQLGCDAFYLGVYDSVLGILLEVNAQGQTFISGSPDPGVRVYSFYGEQINDPELVSDFHLLQVPESFQKVIKVNEDPELVQKESEWWKLYELYQEHPELAPPVIEFPDDEAFQKGYTERIDEALQEAIGCLNSYDITHSELSHRSGVETIKLYFQLPDNYQPQQMYCTYSDD
jgi:hypothetical protein